MPFSVRKTGYIMKPDGALGEVRGHGAAATGDLGEWNHGASLR